MLSVQPCWREANFLHWISLSFVPQAGTGFCFEHKGTEMRDFMQVDFQSVLSVTSCLVLDL